MNNMIYRTTPQSQMNEEGNAMADYLADSLNLHERTLHLHAKNGTNIDLPPASRKDLLSDFVERSLSGQDIHSFLRDKLTVALAGNATSYNYLRAVRTNIIVDALNDSDLSNNMSLRTMKREIAL